MKNKKDEKKEKPFGFPLWALLLISLLFSVKSLLVGIQIGSLNSTTEAEPIVIERTV